VAIVLEKVDIQGSNIDGTIRKMMQLDRNTLIM